ncbi:MAG: zinc-binding dehydrogenase [Alphaproteobacteria bacterium]|nr:zinc-binding dehydrogenase [Alphaproteobacteria bacterium]
MKQVVLRAALTAAPTADDFALIDAAAPSVPPDGVVAETLYLSIDPYIGARLRGRHMGEAPPRPSIDPIPAAAIVRVLDSSSPLFAPGDYAHTMHGSWSDCAALPATQLRKLDPDAAPLSAHLSALGMPGLTAWAGLTQLARVRSGDVVLVDAAAGAVGGAVGQIARITGARAIGIAGGAEKCAIVRDEYRFDACVDYRAPDWQDALDAALPAPPTIIFENVSTAMLAAGLQRAAPYARVVLCGLADHYQADAPPAQIPVGLVMMRRASLHGLVVYDFYDRWDAFVAEAGPWVRDGRLAIREDRMRGLESAPALLEKLMRGANLGKCVIDLT